MLAPRPHVLRSRRTVDVWGVERAKLVRLQDALCDPPNVSGDGMVWGEDLALELLEQFLVSGFRKLAKEKSVVISSALGPEWGNAP